MSDKKKPASDKKKDLGNVNNQDSVTFSIFRKDDNDVRLTFNLCWSKYFTYKYFPKPQIWCGVLIVLCDWVKQQIMFREAKWKEASNKCSRILTLF